MTCADVLSALVTRESLIPIVFGLLAVGTLLVLWIWHRSDKTDVDLTDLLMEGGRLSKLAITWLGAFAVMTFGFIYLLLTKALTDTYAALYAATWAVPIITKLFAVRPALPGVPSKADEAPPPGEPR